MDIAEEAMAKLSEQSPPRPRKRSELGVSLRIESTQDGSGHPTRSASLNRPVAYQLKITLTGIEPPIWRRVLIPGPLTLNRLHHVIQQLMGWINAHPHEFIIGGGRGTTSGGRARRT